MHAMMKRLKKNFWTPILKGLAILGVLLICCGIGGWVYTYRIDHRSVPSLSAYCDIDFKTARDGKGRVSSATLSILDYRYSNTRFSPQLRVYIDGIALDIDGTAKQAPPTYSLTVYDEHHSFKNTNKLFIEFPAEALPELKAANEIRVQLKYSDGTVLDLPLNAPDLAYWQEQLK